MADETFETGPGEEAGLRIAVDFWAPEPCLASQTAWRAGITPSA